MVLELQNAVERETSIEIAKKSNYLEKQKIESNLDWIKMIFGVFSASERSEEFLQFIKSVCTALMHSDPRDTAGGLYRVYFCYSNPWAIPWAKFFFRKNKLFVIHQI